jgi:hypothetical protein
VNPQAELEILVYRLIERVGPLEYHADFASQKDQVGVRRHDILSIYEYTPVDPDLLGKIVYPVKASKQSAFAASAWPDHRGDVAVRYMDIDILKGMKVPVKKVQMLC